MNDSRCAGAAGAVRRGNRMEGLVVSDKESMPADQVRAGAAPIDAVRAVDLHMNFAGVKALNGVDFALAAGETVGVLGPNGSGKTTFVNCLSGVLVPTSGDVWLEGHRITRTARNRRAKSGMIRTFQNLRLFMGMTVAENIEIGLGASGRISADERRTRVRAALRAQDLLDVAHRPAGELPYGVQRRTEIARALIAQPSVLLLDEPGAGLGKGECDILVDALRDAKRVLNCAILIIDHNVPFVASLADRMILLSGGRVAKSARPKELLADPSVAEIYLGKSAHA